jgi:hypothetical protein
MLVFQLGICTGLARSGAMTALRTTQASRVRSFHRTGWAAVALLALCMVGCGGGSAPDFERLPGSPPPALGANDPNWLTSRTELPPPDTDRIDYDSQQRVLTFYELPGRDHWMVQLPAELGRPVGPRHRLPEGIDPADIRVYYCRPGAKVSASVTVAQIQAVRAHHTSTNP